MSHKLLSAVSILPALLIMPALALTIDENTDLNATNGVITDGLKLDKELSVLLATDTIDITGVKGVKGTEEVAEVKAAEGVSVSKKGDLTLGGNNTTNVHIKGNSTVGIKIDNATASIIGKTITVEGKGEGYLLYGANVQSGVLTIGGDNTTEININGIGSTGHGVNVKNSTVNAYGENINITSGVATGVVANGGSLTLGNDSTKTVSVSGGSTSTGGVSLNNKSNMIINAEEITLKSEKATAANVITGGMLTLNGSKINIEGSNTKGKYAIDAQAKTTTDDTAVDITGTNLNVTGAVQALSKGSITANVTESITINADNEAVVSGITISGKTAKPGDSSVNLSANKIDITSNSSYGIHATGLADKKQTDTHTIDLVGNDISIIAKGDVIENEDPAKIFIPSAVYAERGGCVTIKKAGDDGTKSVVNIKSDNGYGVLSQNATSAADNSGLISTVDIQADKIDISGGLTGIVAMSQGIVNLTGDTTISGGTSAISARGDAKVNINTDGAYTTKIDGDINFGYNDSTSGTPVDALVNVVLAGADSYWNGNTIVSYDKKPADETKLNVSNATITLKDGATWNATKITDIDGLFYTALNNLNIDNGVVNIADTTRGIAIDNADIKNGTFTGGHIHINKTATIADTKFVRNNAKNGGAIYNDGTGDKIGNGGVMQLSDVTFINNSATQGGAIYNSGKIELAGNNMFSGNRAGTSVNDIYNDGTVKISGGDTTMLGGILGNGDFTLSDGATLNLGTATIQQKNIQIDGTVNAAILDSNNFGRLYGDVNFGDNAELNLNVATAGTYKIFNTDTFDKFSSDNINAGTLFSVENTADGVVISARAADDIAADAGLSNVAAATLVGLANGGNAVASINAQRALSRGDTDYIEAESVKSAPADKPITHSVATSVQNQVLSLVASRMAGVSTGRSGGDFVTTGAGMWAHGLINRSKMNNSFHGDTRGMAVGVDATFNRKYTFGMGYAYGDTDVHVGDNKTDIESNTLFAYAQYKPSNWFLNGAFNYTFADYSTRATLFGVSMTSEYDVDSYGAQLMTGYDFATGVTPMAGVRYLHISQDDYNNGIANVKSDDSDFMTGVAGLKYAFDINVDRDFILQPELRAAATYDFMSDESIATVLMPGAATYVVNADRLSRFGGEFGIGMSALYRGVTVSLNYDLDLHKDYTSQTGMLKFRYNF